MKIGMVFPGYGSQFAGMGKELYDESRVVQEYFEEAANCLDVNFVKLCFASSDVELAQMQNAYTSLLVISGSFAAHLKQEGIVPDVVAGYGIGEYSAIHAAGGITFPDGLYLLSKYSIFYRQLLDSIKVAGIHVSGITTRKLQKICTEASTQDSVASIAVQETFDRNIVTGHEEAVKRVRDACSAADGTCKEVPLEAGLHSELMAPVVENVKIYLEKVDFKTLSVPLITNAGAKAITKGDAVRTAYIKQIHSPILWQKSMQALHDCDLIIEVGPGSYLTAMLTELYPEKQCVTFNKPADLQAIKTIIESNIIQPQEE